MALSLTVFSGIYPESVPDATAAKLSVGSPVGAGLTLHVGFPLGDGSPLGRFAQECEWVDGGKCYQGSDYSSGTQATKFWDNHAGRDHGFTQPESFWLAMEAKLAEWAERARAEAGLLDFCI